MILTRFSLYITLFLVISAQLTHAKTNPYHSQQRTKKRVLLGNQKMALSMYRKLVKNKKGNFFFSPYSISTILAMAYVGARSKTASEIASALRIKSVPQLQFHKAFASMNRSIMSRNSEGVDLRIVNQLWSQKRQRLSPLFISTLKRYYNSIPKQVDFLKKTHQIMARINRSIRKKTEGMIPQALHFLAPHTRMILLNAIFFKGMWASKFKKYATQTARFYTTRGRRIKVNMMYQEGRFRYRKIRGLQLLELPYLGAKISMIVLLPRSRRGWRWLEKKLTFSRVKRWTRRMYKQKVEVYFPKFRILSKIPLKKVLRRMGIRRAFGRKADFSGIDGSKELYISKIFQQALVEVNEKGTRASAVTIMRYRMKDGHSNTPPPPVFRANRPFVFLLRDNPTNTILCMGRVARPTLAIRKIQRSSHSLKRRTLRH